MNNRQRRAAKRRKQRPGRSSGAGHSHASGWGAPEQGFGRAAPGQQWPTLYVTVAALEAAAAGDEATFDESVRTLSGRSDAEPCLLELFRDLLDVLFDHGWQPREIPLAVVRLGAAGSETLAMAAISAWAARRAHLRAEWIAQIADAGGVVPWPGDAGWLRRAGAGQAYDRGAAVRQTVTVLSHLQSLPAIEAIGPGPTNSSADFSDPDAAGIDEKLLSRVRALLAKAESTDFPAEAEALSAKAQQLITRHSLDRAALAAGVDTGPARTRMRRVWFDRPYVSGKSYLFQQVAEANRCRTVFFGRLGFSTVVGAAADLDVVEMLFTSLLVQATRAMLAAGTQRDGRGRSRTRAFRSSFFVGFATRIGERLRHAADTATEAAGDEVRAAALPVLARQSDAVDEAMREAFPHMLRSEVSATHNGGYVAGQIAAERADLASGELPVENRSQAAAS